MGVPERIILPVRLASDILGWLAGELSGRLCRLLGKDHRPTHPSPLELQIGVAASGKPATVP
ncbi:MAG: hypothetical protein ACRDRC_14210, partial [Pseudonocardiaceae bacterium]